MKKCCDIEAKDNFGYYYNLNQSDRNAGISILKIIAMIWVIFFHFSDHGVVDMITVPLNASWIVLVFGRIGGG